MMPDPGVNIRYYRDEDRTYIMCENCYCSMHLDDDIPMMTHALLAFQHRCRTGLVGNRVLKNVGIKDWV